MSDSEFVAMLSYNKGKQEGILSENVFIFFVFCIFAREGQGMNKVCARKSSVKDVLMKDAEDKDILDEPEKMEGEYNLSPSVFIC